MEAVAKAAVATAILLAMTGVVFGALALFVKRRRILSAMVRAKDEFVTNLGLTLLNLILIAPLVALPEAMIRETIGVNPALVAFWSGVPWALALLATILVADFNVYWRHRAEHHPLLWPIHATHHADTAIHWLSVMRKHPLSKTLSMLVDALLLLLLGLPVAVIVPAMIIRSWWGFFIHADVPWTLGPLGKLLISPAAHRLHHIRDETLMGTNYGNTVTLWDKLFGTYCDPKPYLNCETGIEEGTRGFLGELARPFEKRYRRGLVTKTEPELEPAA